MSSFGNYFRVTTAGGVPRQSAITTPRDEKDRVTIGSGLLNEDQRPKDYAVKTIDVYLRPSHADWTYLEKYGIKASSGGGRSSARETIACVAAGAVAKKWLREAYGVEIVAFVSSVGKVKLFDDIDSLSSNPKFLELYDSIGGIVTYIIRRCPSGLGEPCFDKLEALLAYAIMLIPATKGFEIGSSFYGAKMRGSVYNDPFTTARYDASGEGVLAAKGRHDPNVVPRAVPIVEAMAALTIADALMAQHARQMGMKIAAAGR
ncbi:hypothetical protein MY11210_006401 [Beauveria gryllotalpidicola]